MHYLEQALLVTTIAVKHDEIGKAELVRRLQAMLSASMNYLPEDGEQKEFALQVDQWGKRVEHIMYPGGIEEGEQ